MVLLHFHFSIHLATSCEAFWEQRPWFIHYGSPSPVLTGFAIAYIAGANE